ncbi:MAG: hypothetical protein EHM70_21130 [Chloroflexota bacterium]|nr:MAG: hypothetical protein EHM70_21130 [Chloroflexota bacterium]
MTAQAVSTKTNKSAALLLSVVSLLFAGSVLLGLTQKIGLSDRAAFFILVIAGFTACAMGKLGQGHIYGWFNFRHILGYVFGSLALLLAVAVLFQWPFIGSERSAFLALAVLMLVKTGIAVTYPRR